MHLMMRYVFTAIGEMYPPPRLMKNKKS